MCGNGGHSCPKMTHVFKNCRFYQCVSDIPGKSRSSNIYRLAFFRKMHIMCLLGMGTTPSDRIKFHIIFGGKRVEL